MCKDTNKGLCKDINQVLSQQDQKKQKAINDAVPHIGCSSKPVCECLDYSGDATCRCIACLTPQHCSEGKRCCIRLAPDGKSIPREEEWKCLAPNEIDDLGK